MIKVLLFGTGASSKRVERYINFEQVEILAYIDNDKQKQGMYINNKIIISPNEINNFKYDYIIIASIYNQDIKTQLLGININEEKIIDYYEINEKLFNVRVSSLKLISEEIYYKKVDGSVAELGVYRGDFSKIINKLFPDRLLYLFDTFEGFDLRDVEKEQTNNLSNAQVKEFSNTNMDIVMNKMVNKNNCIIKKGYFPLSALGLKEKFAFVSIDADLYNPIYEGLKYFYPKLSKGGYILIHDYNNASYTGAKKAVREFCFENDINYFPLSDVCGSVVIIK